MSQVQWSSRIGHVLAAAGSAIGLGAIWKFPYVTATNGGGAFLLVFLRVTGRRQVGQYAPFDLVLLLILSNAVQNSMNAGDNSLVGGLISAATPAKVGLPSS